MDQREEMSQIEIDHKEDTHQKTTHLQKTEMSTTAKKRKSDLTKETTKKLMNNLFLELETFFLPNHLGVIIS